MKKMRSLLAFLSIVFLSTLVACDDDDDQGGGKYEDGIFVVNEGNFMDADGTVSHLDESGTVTLDLFGLENNDKALGDVVQSMYIDEDDDVAYIIVNNSNKMEIVNPNTFKSLHTVSDLSLPRYFTTYDGKGYLTEWVSFSDPGHVAVVDLESHEVTNTITTDYGAENIIAHNDLLYVSNNFSNTVSVIDVDTEEVIKTIEVGSSPGEFVMDVDQKIWVICGGTYNGNDGSLVQLDPSESRDVSSNSVLKTIELEMNVTPKAAINSSGSHIYFFKGKSVYEVATTATEAPASPLITEASVVGFYGIGIDPDDDIIYLADGKAFSGNGEIYWYTANGTLIDHTSVGRGPNGFVFEE